VPALSDIYARLLFVIKNDMSVLYPFREVPPRIFDTERLHLRAAGISDLELVFKVYTSNPIATKYMFWPRSRVPQDGGSFLEFVDASFAGKPSEVLVFSWLIQIKATGECIGGCGIGRKSGATVDGGYILNPAFWGKGYAAEAWKPIVDWAKTQPEIQRIEAAHHPDNQASGAVMRKVGLTFQGNRRSENAYPNLGECIVDDVVYAWVR
jgi:RimJ/RimL family protein N-acetyltransferase